MEDKVACVGNENEPTIEVEMPKLSKEELNRYITIYNIMVHIIVIQLKEIIHVKVFEVLHMLQQKNSILTVTLNATTTKY